MCNTDQCLLAANGVEKRTKSRSPVSGVPTQQDEADGLKTAPRTAANDILTF
jgi:hypothetical protein